MAKPQSRLRLGHFPQTTGFANTVTASHLGQCEKVPKLAMPNRLGVDVQKEHWQRWNW
jgi:hypothetical protein